MKLTLAFVVILPTIIGAGIGITHAANPTGNTRFVNPLIGTANDGHTYPGATVPFGLVQASPDTGLEGWHYCSGYRYEDSTIFGFSQTHLSGTGCPDLGDILLLPFTGDAVQNEYKSKFSHQNESAHPGYYMVALEDYGVKAEVTASQRCAFYRFKFENTNAAHLLLDLRSGMVSDARALNNHVIRSELQFEDATTISGYHITDGWGGKRHVYFTMHLDQPVASITWLAGETNSRNQRVVLNLNNGSNLVLQAKIALSTVSQEGAKANLLAEMPDWDFDQAVATAYSLWDGYLSKLEVQGTEQDLQTFYTALYHSLIAPNNIADADGQYRGADNKVYVSDSKAYYSTLSLWDVHRAAIPLYTILYPEVAKRIADTLLRHFDVAGYLPVWTLWGHENNCMIGNPSIPVLADAYLKGLLTFDEAQHALDAVKKSSMVDHPKTDWAAYMKYGYLPSDIVKEEAVSRTLEFGVDDACVAAMAKKMRKTDDQAFFARRANFYTNLFDPSVGLMRGKNSDGKWVTPFNPLLYSHAGDAGGDFTEANAWNYTWHVQQDPQGLIRLMGGDEKFANKLDQLFALPSTVVGANTVDITGLIGQYVHGNEPCHHIAYLYNYVGMPWKAQERLHTIITTLYSNTPAGIPGNDDCGQMSAWYVFSMMGFYPVNPAGGIYVLGTPSLDEASIDVGGGHTFHIQTVRKNSGDFYIDHITHNGAPYPYSYITHTDVMQGGTFTFFMASKPNKDFGRSNDCRPPSQSQ